MKLPYTGPDGPNDHEVCRPEPDKLGVADPPGRLFYSKYANYPFKLDAYFYLIVTDIIGTRIAQIEYKVEIVKTEEDDIPNTVNRVYAIKKRDLVRNWDLWTRQNRNRDRQKMLNTHSKVWWGINTDAIMWVFAGRAWLYFTPPKIELFQISETVM